MPRKYDSSKRKAGMETTRRRIVEATLALHAEQGIAATSYRDIAARADVGIGTVYHHFPDYDEIVRACGVLTDELTLPPTLERFADDPNLESGLARFVAERFAFFERFPTYGRVRCERHTFPAVAEFFERQDQAAEELARRVLRPIAPTDVMMRTVLALTDFAVFHSLIASGMSATAAAEQVTQVLLAWLRSATCTTEL